MSAGYIAVERDRSDALPAVVSAGLRSLILGNIPWEVLLLLGIQVGLVRFSRARPQVPAPPICPPAMGWGLCEEALVFLTGVFCTFPRTVTRAFRGWVKGPGRALGSPGWTGRTQPCRAGAQLGGLWGQAIGSRGSHQLSPARGCDGAEGVKYPSDQDREMRSLVSGSFFLKKKKRKTPQFCLWLAVDD